MNKRWLHPATTFLLLSVAVILLSWIGTIYRWEGVNSMLGLENLRWLLRNFVHEFFNQPVLPYIFFLFFACGLFVHSGLADAFRRLFKPGVRIARKERLALWAVLAISIAYLMMLLFAIFGPYNLLRSVAGTIANSPFSQGLVLIIGFIISVISVIYGITTDFYHSDRDVYQGMAYYFKHSGDFFVILFFIAIFFMLLERSGFAFILGLNGAWYDFISTACSLFALLWSMKTTISNQKKHHL